MFYATISQLDPTPKSHFANSSVWFIDWAKSILSKSNTPNILDLNLDSIWENGSG